MNRKHIPKPAPADPGFDNLLAAKKEAARVSAVQKGIWYVIEAGDLFFVQDTCQLQGWDILHAKYINGGII